MKARSRQLSLLPATRPSRLGRPRQHDAGIAHVKRPSVSPRAPLHVTVRLERGVYNLRSRRSFRVVERALWAASERSRICHYSVQGNHLHMLVEASDKRALSSCMRSFGIRLGLGMNKLMQRRGKVVAHRYHARQLRTPTEVRRALGYVLNNRRQHEAEQGRTLRADQVDEFSSQIAHALFVPPTPKTWLLAAGWKRGSPIRPSQGRASTRRQPP